MLIKELRLHNIRSYEDETINFDTGITLLSGDIGSGKSSILLAIEFALFGFIKGTVSGDLLLRKGASTGSVDLTFVIDDKTITINRTLKKSKDDIGQGTGSITLNNHTTHLTAVELKDKILELLGYPKSLLTKSKSLLFRYTVYTPQELMKQILFEDVEERLDSLRKVFDLEKYKLIKDNMAILNAYLRQNLAVLQNTLLNQQDVEKEISELNEKKKQNDAKINEIRLLLNDADSRMKYLGDAKRTFEEKIKQFNERSNIVKMHKTIIIAKKKQNDDLSGTIKNLSAELDMLKTRFIPDILEPINEQDISNRILLATNELNKISNEKLLLENRLKHLEQNRLELDKQRSLLEKELEKKDGLEQELEKTRRDADSLKDAKEHLEIIRNDLAKINSEIEHAKKESLRSNTILSRISQLKQCPTCQQMVNDEHKERLRNDEAAKIEQNDKIIEDLTRQHADKTAMLRDHEARAKEFDLANAKSIRLNSEIAHLKSREQEHKISSDRLKEMQAESERIKLEISNAGTDKIDSYHSEINKLKEELDNARKINAKINEQKMIKQNIESKEEMVRNYSLIISKNDAAIGESNAIITDLEKDISSLDVNKEFNEVIAELESCMKTKHEHEIKLSICLNDNDNADKRLKLLDFSMKKIEENRAKHAKLEKTRSYANNEFIEIVDAIEKQTLYYVNQEFNETFQRWFNLLIEENMSARIDENFNVLVNAEGYDYSLEALSGGEKTAVALAYRLALNQVINSIQVRTKTKDILILDEPTDGFSKEQLDKVRDVLTAMNTKQIIIVSHEAMLESFADRIIRIEKINGKSKVNV